MTVGSPAGTNGVHGLGDLGGAKAVEHCPHWRNSPTHPFGDSRGTMGTPHPHQPRCASDAGIRLTQDAAATAATADSGIAPRGRRCFPGDSARMCWKAARDSRPAKACARSPPQRPQPSRSGSGEEGQRQIAGRWRGVLKPFPPPRLPSSAAMTQPQCGGEREAGLWGKLGCGEGEEG